MSWQRGDRSAPDWDRRRPQPSRDAEPPRRFPAEQRADVAESIDRFRNKGEPMSASGARIGNVRSGSEERGHRSQQWDSKRSRLDRSVMDQEKRLQFGSRDDDEGLRKLPARRFIPEPPRISGKISWELPTPLVDRQPSKSQGQYPRPPPAPRISSNRTAEFEFCADDEFRSPSMGLDVSIENATIPLMLRADHKRFEKVLENKSLSIASSHVQSPQVSVGEIPLQIPSNVSPRVKDLMKSTPSSQTISQTERSKTVLPPSLVPEISKVVALDIPLQTAVRKSSQNHELTSFLPPPPPISLFNKKPLKSSESESSRNQEPQEVTTSHLSLRSSDKGELDADDGWLLEVKQLELSATNSEKVNSFATGKKAIKLNLVLKKEHDKSAVPDDKPKSDSGLLPSTFGKTIALSQKETTAQGPENIGGEAEIEEDSKNAFDMPSHKMPPLPDGWIQCQHMCGMPVFMHSETRVATFSRPYLLGSDKVRSHEPPLTAIPCLAWTVDPNDTTSRLLPKPNVEDLRDYCQKRFATKRLSDGAAKNRNKKSENAKEKARKVNSRVVSSYEFPVVPICHFPVATEPLSLLPTEISVVAPNGKHVFLTLDKRSDPVSVMDQAVQKIFGEVPLSYEFPNSTPELYLCQCLLKGEVISKGLGVSKKSACHEAAVAALQKLAPDFPIQAFSINPNLYGIDKIFEERLRVFYEVIEFTDSAIIEEFLEDSRNPALADVRRLPDELLAALLKVEKSELWFELDMADPTSRSVPVTLQAQGKTTRSMYRRKWRVRTDEKLSESEIELARQLAAHKMMREAFPMAKNWWDVVKVWLDDQMERLGWIDESSPAKRKKFMYGRLQYLCTRLKKKEVISTFKMLDSSVKYRLDRSGPWLKAELVQQIEELIPEDFKAELEADIRKYQLSKSTKGSKGKNQTVDP